jgi:hypothetical protein
MRKILALILMMAFCPVFAAEEEPAEVPVRAKRGFFQKRQPAEALDGKGYMGKLPKLSTPFITTEEGTAKPIYESTEDFHSANQVKPAPRDNPAFVNIILKTDRTSPYLNDINGLLPVIEKIYNSIENKEDVQRFNAAVYYFNKNADHLRDKYNKKPESNYTSFRKILELSMHAQTIALLRSEALKYNPYLAYGGGGAIYNTDNINQQIEYLKFEIEETIVAIKEAE